MGEIHLFLLWSAARHAEEAILDDITTRFRLLDLVEVRWSARAFTRNLRCLYGSALPEGSHKEQHAGTGPFLVAVVEARRPRHRLRRMGSGRRWVDADVVDARKRYRAMTGGGYRVHASESPREADRDLVLLFGRRATDFVGTRPTGQVPRRHDADVVGARGWRDVDELLLALHVTSGRRVLPSTPGLDLVVEVADEWWAREVLRQDATDGDVEVVVGGRPFRVGIVERPARRWQVAERRVAAWLPPRVSPGHGAPA